MEKKAKKLKELFVQDLAQVQGGKATLNTDPKCPEYTTRACGEEPIVCVGC